MIADSRAFVAGLAVVLLMPGCGTRRYPDDAVKALMASCAAEPNASKTGCLCIVSEYEAKYTYSEFAALDAQLRAGTPSGELQTFMAAAGQRCAENSANVLPRCFFEGWSCTVRGMKGKCIDTYVVSPDGRESPQKRCNPVD